MTTLKQWKTWILFGLLAGHSLWIGFHLSLAATDSVNPWKLGGYGMYVEPKRSVRPAVAVRHAESGPYVAVETDIDRFLEDNHFFNLYCKVPTTRSLQSFFQDNQGLVGREIQLILYAPEFKTDPLRVDYNNVTELYIKSVDEYSFTYGGTVCGRAVAPKRVLYQASSPRLWQ